MNIYKIHMYKRFCGIVQFFIFLLISAVKKIKNSALHVLVTSEVSWNHL